MIELMNLIWKALQDHVWGMVEGILFTTFISSLIGFLHKIADLPSSDSPDVTNGLVPILRILELLDIISFLTGLVAFITGVSLIVRHYLHKLPP